MSFFVLFCLFVSQLVALEIVLLDGQSITLVWKISQQLMAEMSQTSSLPHGMRFEIEIKSGYCNFSCCAVISYIPLVIHDLHVIWL